jgi:pyrroline-5-carboxylate reductase
MSGAPVGMAVLENSFVGCGRGSAQAALFEKVCLRLFSCVTSFLVTELVVEVGSWAGASSLGVAGRGRPALHGQRRRSGGDHWQAAGTTTIPAASVVFRRDEACLVSPLDAAGVVSAARRGKPCLYSEILLGRNHMARNLNAKKKVAILGAGKMGSILLQSFLRDGLLSPAQTWATAAHPERARMLKEKLKVHAGTDNSEAAKDADIIFVCVKPQVVADVVREISSSLNEKQLIISVAASVPTEMIERALEKEVPVVRAMPNTPCVLGAGMTALCKGKFATKQHMETASKFFDAVGRTVILDEKHMDAVTGLSASGPAYIYIILESLAEAGVKVGLPRDVATLLAAQTTMGAARVVLETGDHPALLKDAVTTPAGCTIDGIMELEEGKLRVTLIKAVVKAVQRAKELAFS